MELQVIDAKGASAATVSGADALFGREFNEALVHQIVVAYQANARLATRKQLGRGEVAKSKKKPWRQKGTGRARSGKASSPLWRGGGKIFPASPDENFEQKVNRKMYRAGMASILSQLVREERLKVVDDFTVESPKTRDLQQKIRNMGLDEALVITDRVDDKLWLSSRNLPGVLVLAVHQTDPMSLVHFRNVLLTRKALSKLEEIWS